MTNQYTHNICLRCWADKTTRRPTQLMISDPYHVCCFCGVFNSDRIFTPNKPKVCEGEHASE